MRFEVVILITFPGPNAPNNALPKISLLKSKFQSIFMVFLVWLSDCLKGIFGHFSLDQSSFYFLPCPASNSSINKFTLYRQRNLLLITSNKLQKVFPGFLNIIKINVNIILIKLTKILLTELYKMARCLTKDW